MKKVDYLVIGGGFYGSCLAIFLRSVTPSVMLIEAGDEIMSRASRINQARLHSGFHYPRSMITALKSQMLCNTFAAEFPEAIVDNYKMLYAIASRNSKVSANRFFRMFQNMRSQISLASPNEVAFFDQNMIEAVFRVDEYAFDYSILARLVSTKILEQNIDLRLGTEAIRIQADIKSEHAVVQLSDGSEVLAKHVFNVTYSQINSILRASKLSLAKLKHEMTEIVLVEPPEFFEGYAVTVMDGPFFSLMPYPAEKKYSLTHVRYTPHFSWTDQTHKKSAYAILDTAERESKARHMIMDAARYMPSITEVKKHKSLFDVKTVLIKNERDDGRPILVHRDSSNGLVTSLLGGKIDNIFDMMAYLKREYREMSSASMSLMM